MSADVHQTFQHAVIRYGSVWEDADVLCEALAPVARGGRLLSIASAGDNALALLTLDPAEVVAIDLNPAQLAASALRIAAFRRLDHPALLTFLGITPSTDRAATYQRLRADLPPFARTFWDANPTLIAAGAIHAGKFERYLNGFHRYVLPLVHRRRTVERLRSMSDPAAQARFYRANWNNRRWRLLFRAFFSRTLLGRLGRDPALLRQVEGAVSARILARTEHALTVIPARTNPYLTYCLSGNYTAEALPLFLRPEQFETIRARLDRLTLVQGAIPDAVVGPFVGMNLSDLFEYQPTDLFEQTYAALVAASAPGARLVYWNLLVPRSRPPALADRVTPLTALADALHERDKAWFYGALHVDQVRL